MITLKKYQVEAVDNLVQNTYRLVKRPGARQPLVFKAPTGAGKTVIMAAFLNKFCEELPEKLELEKRKACFVWIAPNKLYIQSYNAIKGYFSEMRSIKPVFFEDITDGGIKPNEVLFVNWESINKEKNLMVRENEQNKTLYSYVNQSRLNGTEIIVIIDEEHMFANPRTARRANEVLQKIYPKIEIRVSATPTTNSDYKTIVERGDVIHEEMIKEGIILNPALDSYTQEDGKSLDQTLTDIALKKRKELVEAYEKLNVKINPLLLIQLPNDTSEDITLDDQKYIDSVTQYLEVYHNVSVKNNRMAIWLSGRKDTLADIEKPDNMVDVLLFKQAIALGWDCPRAAVLLIFRELKSTTFTIQTVGRILRMPQQRHYPDPLLNQGYVFTNLSKDRIEIVKDDMNYITMNRDIRKENYKPVLLQSTYINTRIIRNRLGSKFRSAIYETVEKMWGFTKALEETSIYDRNRNRLGEHFISIDVNKIEIVIPENINLTGEIEVKLVTETVRFAKTQDELNILFRQFCRSNVVPFAVVDSAPVLEMALKLLFEEYFGFNEFEAIKIILYQENQPQFIELIAKALDRYKVILEEKANIAKKDVVKYQWEVPAERIYNELYEEKDNPTHVLEPFYQYVKASNPENKFIEFLEHHKENFEWWYKNGESAKEHFAVPYIDHYGKESLFYVDFVILLRNGITCLFDTKTVGSDTANAHLKHNALIDFASERAKSGKPTIGGVIIGKEISSNLVWQFCRNKIENTKDQTGWEFFNPANININ
ncbi:MAG: DEAD/DEAH box helicase family protein [Bacteroidales bacterium]|nr:DEAD/DEAH box helicase family protein [Bacteroidales bacterium]